MRVALLSHNAQAGDAIGNNVAEKVRFFHDRAAQVRVFLESGSRVHPALKGHVTVVNADSISEDWKAGAKTELAAWNYLRCADLICAEFGQYYSLLSLLPLVATGKSRIILDYHGITPPRLWGGNNCEALRKGLEHRGLAWLADATLAHSSFTQDELLAFTRLPRDRVTRLGFPVEAPPILNTAAGKKCKEPLGLSNRRVLLFVGRLAPNKCPVLVVEALRFLSDLLPPVHAVFVGDNSDLYEAEAQKCLVRARQLGLESRVHILGTKLGKQLLAYYEAADVLVVPSCWESFCIPVIEAMACGLPVVAARSSALPETVGSAGLTFRPDDAAHLACQVRRVLEVKESELSFWNLAPSVKNPMPEVLPPKPSYKIAVVASRFGSKFASGAEASLRTMALALRNAGCEVEVFSTVTNSETGTTNDLPAGTSDDENMLVHRFPVTLTESADGLTRKQPIRSPALLKAICSRISEFDYLLTGPYLAGLTTEVVEKWPEKTILVPCFHDEPEAKLDCWPRLYEQVAGIFYHSAQEQAFAERALAINHPGSAVVGTHVDVEKLGNGERGRQIAGAAVYVVYCGRFVAGKNLSLLFEFARRFDAENPGKLRFVFAGQGEVEIPRELWAINLGFLHDDSLRDVLRGALALVQLSFHESLSLAALYAWAQGTPVIGHRHCSVMAEHMGGCGGGWLVENYQEFAAALGDLLGFARADGLPNEPGIRVRLGNAGQQYVREQYGFKDLFQKNLVAAIAQMQKPIAQRMRERGLERAAIFERGAWRRQFAAIVESVLHAAPVAGKELVEIQFRRSGCTARVGSKKMLLPVRLVNRGSAPVLAEGPGRTVITGHVLDRTGKKVSYLEPSQSLPTLVMPGETHCASVVIPIPGQAGKYLLRIWTCRCDRKMDDSEYAAELQLTVLGECGRKVLDLNPEDSKGATLDLSVPTWHVDQGVCLILEEVQTALLEACGLRDLPDRYRDVTTGLFANIKRRAKQKLLGNFKKAYVDVLSRQQSACNQQLLAAIGALMECCATLDHTVRGLNERVSRLEAASETPSESQQVSKACAASEI